MIEIRNCSKAFGECGKYRKVLCSFQQRKDYVSYGKSKFQIVFPADEYEKGSC